MKYSTGTAALMATLCANGALAAPAKGPKNVGILPFVGKNIEPAPITLPYDLSDWGLLRLNQARSTSDDGKIVAGIPGGPEEWSELDLTPYVPEKREAEADPINFFPLTLPYVGARRKGFNLGRTRARNDKVPVKREADADPIFGALKQFVGKIVDKYVAKRDAEAEAEAEPFLADIVKLVGMAIDKATKRDAEAEADPFLADIVKLVGMAIDKVTKRDAEAEAEPFLADIVKLVGMAIDKVTKRNAEAEAEAEPFLADIVKLVGMAIDKVTKRDAEAEAEADPFLADIVKLVGMAIDKAT